MTLPLDPAASCPACGRSGMHIVLEQEGIPTNSCLLLDSLDAARTYPTGRMRLAVCPHCAFLANLDFDTSLTTYSSTYEETQAFSPRFLEFSHALAKRWVERYDLHRRHIVEIGCGKGDFLATMCELGENTGLGIDPAAAPERLETTAAERLEFRYEFFDENSPPLDADVVVSRHTLEHIPDVGDFLRLLRTRVPDNAPVLFDLPDVGRVLRETAFWDVYYEHCSYFTPGSLAALFRRCGFEVVDVALDFDDQYIVLDACPATTDSAPSRPHPLEEPVTRVIEDAEDFARRYTAERDRRRGELAALSADGRRATIWGAGSKGVAWLTALQVSADQMPYAVDINPYKRGKFMAGTGQRIVAPDDLAADPPDVVYVMNSIYLDEIRRVMANLGVTAELRAL